MQVLSSPALTLASLAWTDKMHELAITEAIIETAVPIAKKQGAKRILEIHLEIGAMSGIVPDCISYYLGEVTKGTIAEGAKLISTIRPVQIECSCGYKGSIPDRSSICPECRGTDFKVQSGGEYFIDHLVVE